MTPVEFGYAAAWRLVRALPRPVAAALFRAGADRAHRREAAAVRRLAGNLRRVVGPDMPAAEFDLLLRDAVRSYARYWMEMFRLPSLSHEQRLASFHLAGGEMLGANVAAGQGSVVALPHAGNWDAAGAWVAAQGWPLTTVAERLRPEGVYEQFVAARERLGMEIIPATGGDRPPFDVLVDRIGKGHVVPLLADRDLSARGVEVTFFGGRTRMPPGPALLALRTGAPLYVTTMWFEPDRAHGALDGPVPLPDPTAGSLDERVRLLTQEIADRLAAGIARHPQDWHMMQRLWLDDRPATDQPATDQPATERGRSGTTGPG
ncbi:phosphatidylinositol mannoside acyltransferase [Micromonospora sp. NBC_01813]|uniref:phosphatidylinositol mannoside acyltransferase n=1 Tax=Micromonospora sp. NBC_01813 TaxID=2975988 RepID=UPI002DDA9D15|nr:phosphatidylinositol mannoside acyltransferase [Micromonospora sp. NBC_01813]WSA11030.1 phosphatidylinositol mannoside acyltransferase [Micromonospora sp. NBC_01813]